MRISRHELIMVDSPDSIVPITPDSERFIMLKPAEDSEPEQDANEIAVVLNWTEKLKQLSPPSL